jgi:hypothetical protein
MFKKGLFYSLGLIIIFSASVLMLELAARLLFEDGRYSVNPTLVSEFQHDSLLGWKGIPNYRGASLVSKAEISINSEGFRDPDWNAMLDRANMAGLLKIMALGDSTTYGYEIDRYERFTEQLQELFANTGQDVVIFNAGMPAFGTDQEYRLFEILSPRISPDLVLLRYNSNDIGDSALPYCWGDPKYRVYRPFYDIDGNLILHETVPRRFSLKVKGTVFEHLRLRFAIDKVESLIDDIGYSRRGISENRQIKVENPTKDGVGWTRQKLDMGLVGSHPDFRDIYDKNKMRNFNLIKKLDALCKQKRMAFMVFTDFDGHSDPSHPNQELISFLQKHSIQNVNVAKKSYPYGPWGFVNCDGHPNFLTNYYTAVNIYEALSGKSVPIEYSATGWFGKLASEIDFANGDFHKYLFGGEWGGMETFDGKKGRWLRGGARFLLLGTPGSRSYEIGVRGINGDHPNTIELVEKDGAKVMFDRLGSGQFEIRGQLEGTNSSGLLFFEIRPELPVFIQSIGRSKKKN